MLHGMADDNVHFQQSVRFVDALVTARKDFVLVPLPGQKHSTRAPSVRTYVNQRILEFFEKNL
jgi:dipeptidyl-peptidase-4